MNGADVAAMPAPASMSMQFGHSNPNLNLTPIDPTDVPPLPPHWATLRGLPTQARYLQRVLNPASPSIDDSATRCPICLKWGHLDDTCPERTCEHCGGAHPRHLCANKPRCSSCHRLGHSAESCTPELASSTTSVCGLCYGVGHLEETCTSWFRRYRVENDENVVKMANLELTIGCYQCGSRQHFGGDCPKFPKQLRGPFSAKYVEKFVEEPLPAAIDDIRPGELDSTRPAERVILKPKGRLAKHMKKFSDNFLLDQGPGSSREDPIDLSSDGPVNNEGTAKPYFGGKFRQWRVLGDHADRSQPPQQQQRQQPKQVPQQQCKNQQQPKKSKPTKPSQGNQAAQSNPNLMTIGNHGWGLPQATRTLETQSNRSETNRRIDSYRPRHNGPTDYSQPQRQAGPNSYRPHHHQQQQQQPNRGEAFMSLGYSEPPPPPRGPPGLDDWDDSRYNFNKRQRR